jgi:hypothetical protein
MNSLAFPKPKDQKKEPKPAVKVMKDGREMCNLLTTAGMNEYRRVEEEGQ